jgi:hypothetical protein
VLMLCRILDLHMQISSINKIWPQIVSDVRLDLFSSNTSCHSDFKVRKKKEIQVRKFSAMFLALGRNLTDPVVPQICTVLP